MIEDFKFVVTLNEQEVVVFRKFISEPARDGFSIVEETAPHENNPYWSVWVTAKWAQDVFQLGGQWQRRLGYEREKGGLDS